MAVERPTFSESWYRVANLSPRLRSTVQVHRQHYRGQMWYVLQDPANNQYFRVNVPAYQFVALLDGRRTVAEVWRLCNEDMGDSAPTQGEAIQVLGQLYSSNLLQAELPPDAEGLLQRYRKRKTREIQGYLSNLLFIRVPLIDPDHFLNRWVAVLGRIFTWYGFVAWMVLIGAGLLAIAGRTTELVDSSANIFDPSNLPLMYLAMVLIKVTHEFGHAFACKRFGRIEGGRGEVHIMGVMFLVFMPLPYVDASSAWAFRSKWRRVIVGAGGMFVELAIAAVAAIVWARTAPGTAVHGICYNMMFIASVSTILFNANPLLRFDGYYILSDLLEIPNLYQRSKDYLYYLVKKYVWAVRRLRNPAHTYGEKAWFVFYGIASTIYRVYILFRIILFLSNRLPEQFKVVAILFGVVSGAIWLCVPLGKFFRYLFTNGELLRVRSRAMLTTAIFLACVFVGIGLIRAPDHRRAEGVVEPINMAVIYAATDGFLTDILPQRADWQPEQKGAVLLRSVNRELQANYEQLLAQRRRLEAQLRIAQTKEPAAAQIRSMEITALDEKIRDAEKEIDALVCMAPLEGTWIAPDADRAIGRLLHRGDRVALVADLDKLMIRTVVDQQEATLLEEAYDDVEIRLRGRPKLKLTGLITRRPMSGKLQLPSAALGYAVGGSIQTAMDDRNGTKAAEQFFDVHVIPDKHPKVRLLPGQCVIVRFTMPPKPLIVQWWRSLRQLLQRRFRI